MKSNPFYSDKPTRHAVNRPALMPHQKKAGERLFVNMDIVPTFGRPAMINNAKPNKTIRPQGMRAISGVTQAIRNPFNLELTMNTMNASKALPALYEEI